MSGLNLAEIYRGQRVLFSLFGKISISIEAEASNQVHRQEEPVGRTLGNPLRSESRPIR